jgi:hypothetical protein
MIGAIGALVEILPTNADPSSNLRDLGYSRPPGAALPEIQHSTLCVRMFRNLCRLYLSWQAFY